MSSRSTALHVQVPDTLAAMSQLEELLLDGNKIKQLPDFFGVFSRLRYLDCGFNQLELVSPELGRCTSLLDLTLSSNDLKVIKSQQTGKIKST